jgi:glucosamine--fructose-6-phosphate aminotransferase (isomerizing)
MCGIIGYTGHRKNAAQLVLDGLKTLEYRGYDSWGVAVVPLSEGDHNEGTKIAVKKRVGKIGNADVKELPPGSLAFGHTRWATHGGVTIKNAHPHLDCTRTIALIHNGIFENYEEEKSKLLIKGHKFISDTDSEVIVHLIEEYKKRFSFPQAVLRAFKQMDGLNAIIVLQEKENNLIAIRKGSPLVVGYGRDENFIASDAAAILPYTKRIHFLENEEMVIISPQKVDCFNVRTGKKIQPKKQLLNWTLAQNEKGSYPNFMLKEIYEQPGIVANIAINSVSQAEKLSKIIRKSYGSYLLGCGSASYVAMAGGYLFSKIAGRHINWAIGSEFSYQLDFLTAKSLVIALSQSGETMDILESVRLAKDKGAKVFALVNSFGSSLYRQADYKMLVGAGPEKSVASTKDVTAKLAHLILLSYALAGKTQDGRTVVNRGAVSAEKVLKPKNMANIKKLAKKLKNSRHIYVIGRGLSYPASLETAMKIKEISYVHAEGMAAGELKHGPLALVEKGTPCIVFIPADETYGASLAGAMEMKARGGYVIGISSKKHELFDYYLPVEDAFEATIIPNIITGQILAYYLTMECGLDPDKPRNLAKSVTVK